jgi:hypothetical protein
MEILILFAAMFVGVLFGWDLRERYASHQIKRFLKEVEEAKVEENDSDEPKIPITIEKHNNHFYVYNKENNQFMGQAGSREELEAVLMERFPGKRFACSEETLKEIGFMS